MKDHKPILELWKTPSEFARDVGITLWTARNIRASGWIPAWYWWDVVRIAQQRDWPGVNLERLAKAASTRQAKPRAKKR